jgi:hypothetical protein
MGVINIVMCGSFPEKKKSFSALSHGHAAAIAEAISWLSGECLPDAIKQDHDLHNDGAKPANGFGKY